MQPPPRKVKVTQELKNTHTDQMTRLHFKHQTECDLLDDMRSYTLKKGQLERDYAQHAEAEAGGKTGATHCTVAADVSQTVQHSHPGDSLVLQLSKVLRNELL
ncbi:unnamed protein product [Arctogadus glacialis]